LKLGENYTNVEHTLGGLTIPAAIIVLVLLGVAYYFGKRMGVEERVLEKMTRDGN